MNNLNYLIYFFEKISVVYLLIIITGCSNRNFEIQDQFRDVKHNPVIPLNYIIGPSDELEVFYYIDPEFSTTTYLIDTEDTLRIDFYYYPEISRTVKVRPDGFITLPKVGDIKAAGEFPHELSKKISELFSEYLSRPIVTVELIEFNAKIANLKEAIKTTSLGQAKRVVVRPDGRISLPYLKKDVKAAGRTTLELGSVLEDAYRKHIKNISITVALLNAQSYQACIIGDVRENGYYSLYGSTTLLQLISRAGGFTKKANMEQVVIIRLGKENTPKRLVIDVEKILNQGRPDPVIHQYDVVYIPSTWLGDAALTAESLFKLIPIRFSYVFDYSIK